MIKLFVIIFMFQNNIKAELNTDLVWKKIDEVDQFRIKMASTINDKTKITEDVFSAICKPAGIKAKKIAEEFNWKFNQVSHKNRNEKNALDEDVKLHYEKFLNDPNRKKESYQTKIDGKVGVRYLQKIVIQDSCLHCHGNKEKLPDFIKTKYPHDKANDFKVGEIRGLYSVFIPNN